MKVLCLFALRFALIFGLLAWPWPGLRHTVGICFRSGTSLLLSAAFPKLAFQVEALSDPRFPSSDTRVIVPEWQDVEADGTDGRRVTLAIFFDSSSQGWIPLAMLIALGVATPLSWSKRRLALLIGCLLIQMLLLAATILVSVAFNLSVGISSAGIRLLIILANRLMVENIWFNLVSSFLLWVGWLIGGGYWKQLQSKLSIGDPR